MNIPERCRRNDKIVIKPTIWSIFCYSFPDNSSKEAVYPNKEWNPPMLVLTRKVGEGIGEGIGDGIKINDDVKITVIEVKGKNMRFGIEAPKTTKIYRE